MSMQAKFGTPRVVQSEPRTERDANSGLDDAVWRQAPMAQQRVERPTMRVPWKPIAAALAVWACIGAVLWWVAA